MLFSSLIFIFLFLPLVVILYYGVFRFNRKMQNLFLLLASLGFYAWGEPWFVLVMIGSIFLNWVFGLLVYRFREGKMQSRLIITGMLLVNLGIIFIFKYLMFTLENLNRFAGTSYGVPQIILPIGISFFTFQAISYVIDIYRGKGSPQRNPLNVGLYIAFFPQLIAGPIVRYETIADQIMNRKETWTGFSEGATRFVIGFLKKVLLANNFALLADKAFSMPADEISLSFAWFGAICYTLQIYYDFSGYSDMAIGLGRMFGFRFPENFNYPYISRSTTEFWRRWHISLGSWFRDYVYFPLGGSRVNSRKRVVFNLLVVWSLTGLWHGANWTFILWGLLYFVSISLEKLIGFEGLGQGRHPVLVLGAKHLYTMLLVIFGWVLFRSENLTYAGQYLSAMLGLSQGTGAAGAAWVYTVENWVFLVAGIGFSMPVTPALRRWLMRNRKETLIRKLTLPGQFVYGIAVTGLFLIGVTYLVKGSYNPFIYFNF